MGVRAEGQQGKLWDVLVKLLLSSCRGKGAGGSRAHSNCHFSQNCRFFLNPLGMGLLPPHLINGSTWALGEDSLGSTKYVLDEAVGQLWVCSCRCEAFPAVGAAASAKVLDSCFPPKR